MIGALVLWAGVANAQGPAELLAELPAPAAVVLGCHSLLAAGDWFSGGELGLDALDRLAQAVTDADQARAAGLDPDGPLMVVASAGGDHVIAVFPLADESLFRAEILPLLIDEATPSTDAPDTWFDEAGDPLTLSFTADTATLRVGPDTAPAVQSSVLPGLVERVEPDLGGCWLAGDVLALGVERATELGAEAILVQGSATGDQFRVNLIGVPMEEQVGGALTGLKPARRTHGRSSVLPDIAVRINSDPIEALTTAQQLSMLLGRGLPPVVGTAGALLENSGLEVLPGVELAMGGLFTPTEPYATLVLPVARPLSRRGLDKRIAQAFSDKGLDPVKLGDAWSLDDVDGMDGWWLGTTRGAVLLSTRAELVQEMTDGAGETWIPAETADLAGEPGLWGRADLRGLPFGIPVVATAHLGAPAPGEVALIIDAPGLMDAMTDQLPGLVEDRAGSLGGQVGRAPADDPVGNPRSTEALSVLMLISSREEATLKSGGAYLPYTGGPREVEALDGTAVPWEGIPELDLAPMDAACRYEVRVDHEGWLATAWCDQDVDGEPAVLLLRPGGTPIRVSPPGVR